MSLTVPSASSSNLRKRKLFASPQPDQDGDDGLVIKGEEEEEKDPKELKADALKLWNSVNDIKDPNGFDIAQVYRKLPSKRQYPDYYALIKRPMALEDIKSRIYGLKYKTLTAVRDDLLLVFRNAMRYNVKDSQIWLDAKLLKKHLLDEYDAMMGKVKEPDTKKNKKSYTLVKWMTRVVKELNEVTDEGSRHRLDIFQELPGRTEYPEYYILIKHPISIREIKRKMHRREYQKLEGFVADVKTMFQNALFFNEEGSQVNEDAKVLEATFSTIVADAPREFEPPSADEAAEGKRDTSHDDDEEHQAPKSLKLHLAPGHPKPSTDAPVRLSMVGPSAKIKIKAPVAETPQIVKENTKAPMPKEPATPVKSVALPRPAAPITQIIKKPSPQNTPLPPATKNETPVASTEIQDPTPSTKSSTLPSLIEGFILKSGVVEYSLRASTRLRSHALTVPRSRDTLLLAVLPLRASTSTTGKASRSASAQSSTPPISPAVAVWTNGMITPKVQPAAETGQVNGDSQPMTKQDPSVNGTSGRDTLPSLERDMTQTAGEMESGPAYVIRLGKALTVIEIEVAQPPKTQPATSPGLANVKDAQARPSLRYRIFITQA